MAMMRSLLLLTAFLLVPAAIASCKIETTSEHWIYADGRGFVPAGTLTSVDRIAVAKGRLAKVGWVDRVYFPRALE